MWQGLGKEATVLVQFPRASEGGWARGWGKLLTMEGCSQVTLTQWGGSWGQTISSLPSTFQSSYRCLPLAKPTEGKGAHGYRLKLEPTRVWRRVNSCCRQICILIPCIMESPWGILTGEVMWSDAYFEEITLAAVWRLDYEAEVEARCLIRRPLLWAITATEPLHSRTSHCELAPEPP